MSSLSDHQEKQKQFSYIHERFETAEDSFVANEKSSPIVLGRRESVFLAESSTSSAGEGCRPWLKSQQISSEAFISQGSTIITSESTADSDKINITGDYEYSEGFESLASEEGIREDIDTRDAQEESFTNDDTTCDTEQDKRQDSFISKKLDLLSSGAKPCNHQTSVKDKLIDGNKEMNNFCLRKLEVMSMERPKDSKNYGEGFLMAGKQVLHQPVVGKKLLESLKVENVMKKMEKIKQSDFHNPVHCIDCRTMMSDIAEREFLKRKLDVVKRQDFEDRLHAHLYQRDSATLIAEILNSCTKPTAPASEVWDKLLQRGDK